MPAGSPLRIAWLTTGRGPGSFGALEYAVKSIERGLAMEIAVVFVNRTRGEAEPTDRLIDFVEARGIPIETLSSVAFRKERGGKLSRPGEPLPGWRLEYDSTVGALLRPYRFELGVLFGYMLIATEPLYGHYRLINDHPALPDGPVGTYQEVIAQLMRTGGTQSGCMMNVVTGDVDRGPTVSFCRYGIREASNEPEWRQFEADSAKMDVVDLQETGLYRDIRRRGLERERPFLVETLRAISAGRLAIPPERPLDLTAEVDLILTGQS